MKAFNKPIVPTKAQVLLQKGLFAHRDGKLAEAQACYKQALLLAPKNHDVLHMLGVSEFQLGQFEAARKLIVKSLAVKPDSALAHFNHGNTLRELDRWEEAVAAYQRATRLDPHHSDALLNLGSVYKALNQFAAATHCYQQVLNLRPQHPKSTYNLALLLLMQGELSQGWDLYEQRFSIQANVSRYLGHEIARQAPDWDGVSPTPALLVMPEQGIGDQVFYASMLQDLQAQICNATVCTDARLIPLYQRSFPGLRFIAADQLSAHPDSTQPQYSAQIHLASLGRHFRKDLASVSQVAHPYLQADASHTAQLKHRLQRPGRLLCGLSWSSQNSEHGKNKSLTLSTLLPLLQTAGVDFVDLQYGDTHQERAALEADTGIVVQKLAEIDNRDDIDGLAALISACDLVITISNSTAHLAAALGKTVLVMLPFHSPLWYWQSAGTDSPWYPSAGLFRQTQRGLWPPVIKQVTSELEQQLARHLNVAGGKALPSPGKAAANICSVEVDQAENAAHEDCGTQLAEPQANHLEELS